MNSIKCPQQVHCCDKQSHIRSVKRNTHQLHMETHYARSHHGLTSIDVSLSYFAVLTRINPPESSSLITFTHLMSTTRLLHLKLLSVCTVFPLCAVSIKWHPSVNIMLHNTVNVCCTSGWHPAKLICRLTRTSPWSSRCCTNAPVDLWRSGCAQNKLVRMSFQIVKTII